MVLELRRRLEKRSKGSPHFLLDECCKAMFFTDDYRCFRTQAKQNPIVLDSTNYRADFAPAPLATSDLLELFDVQPSYGSVLGEYELGDVVRRLETYRSTVAAKEHGYQSVKNIQKAVGETVVVAASGATSAAFLALNAAMLRSRETCSATRRKIVYNVPTYCLPDAYAQMYGLDPAPVGYFEDGQPVIPPPAQIAEQIDESTLVCYLTCPDNPSQNSWTCDDAAEFKALIDKCQALDVVVVWDTIFQDLAWESDVLPEIFGLTSGNHLLVKIFSASKDRPGASGYRVGYAVADTKLRPWLEKSKALTENTTSTLAQVWLGFDLTFRLAEHHGFLSDDDLLSLSHRFLFGCDAKELPLQELAQIVEESGLFSQYRKNLAEFKRAVKSALDEVYDHLSQLEFIRPLAKPRFGNILMFEVISPTPFEDDIDFFSGALLHAGVTSLVGRCFGLPIDGPVYGRIAVGGCRTTDVLDGLSRLDRYLSCRSLRDMRNLARHNVS